PVPVTTTSAPSSASASAVARPIPRSRPAPVTSATLPSSESMSRSFCAARSDERRAVLPEHAEVGHANAVEGRRAKAAVAQIVADHPGGVGVVGIVDVELHGVPAFLVGVGQDRMIETHPGKVRDEELGGTPRLELTHDLRGDSRLLHTRMRVDDTPVREAHEAPEASGEAGLHRSLQLPPALAGASRPPPPPARRAARAGGGGGGPPPPPAVTPPGGGGGGAGSKRAKRA